MSIESRFVWTIVIAVILTFSIYVWSMVFFAGSLNANAVRVSASPLPSVAVATASKSVMATDFASVSAKVCTNVPNGRLNVRFNPGEGSDVRGYLAEGETVQILFVNGQVETQSVQGEQWMKLLSPVEGWASASYICDVGK